MKITLDITKEFNSLVNHEYFYEYTRHNNFIFMEHPLSMKEGFLELEQMNFSLNFNDEMEQQLKLCSPHFDDILNHHEEYRSKSILIFGKAKFKFTGVKGFYVKLGEIGTPKDENLYYEMVCKIKKGDYSFKCGGYSAFSPHYTLVRVIADKNAKATITFSSDEYILMDSDGREFETRISAKETPYDYRDFVGADKVLSHYRKEMIKMFDFDFYTKYFEFCHEDGFLTDIAMRDEECFDSSKTEEMKLKDRIFFEDEKLMNLSQILTFKMENPKYLKEKFFKNSSKYLNIVFCKNENGKTPLNNIYALDENNQIIWTVKSQKANLKKTNLTPFIKSVFDLRNKFIHAIDEDNYIYTISAVNGKILKKEKRSEFKYY